MRKKLKIAFLLNPLRDMKHDEDTSFALMAECRRRNHSVFFLESNNLVFHRGVLYGHTFLSETDPKKGLILTKPSLKDLRQLDCLFLRKEPPFNLDYLATTYLLEFLKKSVFLINQPRGVRNTNEKLSALHFTALTPESLVSFGSAHLKSLMPISKRTSWVLKRIDEKGGKGVMKLRRGNRNFNRSVNQIRRQSAGPVVLQKFVPHASGGDKRILLLNGSFLGAFTRIPAKKDFRANMSLGGKAFPAALNTQDLRIIRSLRGYLRRNGLYFTGIDVLEGKLTEINVTSPAGIVEVNMFNKVCLEKQVIDFIEKRI